MRSLNTRKLPTRERERERDNEKRLCLLNLRYCDWKDVSVESFLSSDRIYILLALYPYSKLLPKWARRKLLSVTLA